MPPNHPNVVSYVRIELSSLSEIVKGIACIGYIMNFNHDRLRNSAWCAMLTSVVTINEMSASAHHAERPSSQTTNGAFQNM